MSMGPIGGVIGSAAGAPLAQTKGATSEREAKDAAAQQRTAEADLKSERASGVGQTEGDERSSDRDADGRRLWESPAEGNNQEQQPEAPQGGESATNGPKGPPSEGTGERLDLIG